MPSACGQSKIWTIKIKRDGTKAATRHTLPNFARLNILLLVDYPLKIGNTACTRGVGFLILNI